jgi:predicted protein tyrosine phosphatase
VLDIEDSFRFMDPELVRELQGAVDLVFGGVWGLGVD